MNGSAEEGIDSALEAAAMRPALGEQELRASYATIRVSAGELHATAAAAEDALIAAGIPIFQRGAILVRPVMQELPASHGRMTVAAALHQVDAIWLQGVLCSIATWERFDGRSNVYRRIDPPKNIAELIIANAGNWRFPHIAGIITTPTIRPDGSILSAPGYDEATRLYHAADLSITLPAIVNTPDKRVAERALKALSELLVEFPFVGATEVIPKEKTSHHAVALSAIISSLVRGLLPVVPLHAFRANTPGTGKSFMADVANLISNGRRCPVVTNGRTEEETEKRLGGMLLAGYPLISLDNVNGELGGDLLCQAIERPHLRLRPLGSSRIIEVETSSTIIANGNGLRVRGDLVRRSLTCDLDAEMERPELRKFSKNPESIILANRGKYVGAALAIVRAYILAGRPGKLSPIASFNDWSDNVRSALVWLGCADPASSMENARDDDPKLEQLSRLLGDWPTSKRDADGHTVKELVEAANQMEETNFGSTGEYQYGEWRQTLMDLASKNGKIDSVALGNILKEFDGRIYSGRKVKKGKRAAGGGTIRWCFQFTAERNTPHP